MACCARAMLSGIPILFLTIYAMANQAHWPSIRFNGFSKPSMRWRTLNGSFIASRFRPSMRWQTNTRRCDVRMDSVGSNHHAMANFILRKLNITGFFLNHLCVKWRTTGKMVLSETGSQTIYAMANSNVGGKSTLAARFLKTMLKGGIYG